jgi:hypothetical protein
MLDGFTQVLLYKISVRLQYMSPTGALEASNSAGMVQASTVGVYIGYRDYCCQLHYLYNMETWEEQQR